MKDYPMEYYSCDSNEHLVADCKYQALSQEYARKLRLKKEKSLEKIDQIAVRRRTIKL